MKADYCVIGVGSAGSFAVRELARRGHDVIGVEAGGIANDRCAVGGDTRLYRRLYKEGQHYHPLLERAREIWIEFSHRDPDAFTACGAINLTNGTSPVAQELRAYGETFDIPFAELSSTQVFSRFAQFVPHNDVIGFLDPSGGFVRTDLVVRRAAEDAITAGARILDARALKVIPDGSGVSVETESETVRCEKVIVAAGGRSQQLLPELTAHTTPLRLTMTWFQTTDPENFMASRFPVFSWFFPDYYIYGTPTLDGRHVKVSGMTEKTELEFADFDFDSTVTRQTLKAASQVVRNTMTGVHPVPVRSGTYPDLYTTDSDFLLDYVDPGQRVFAATGFSGKGFKMASAIGEHAAHVVTGEAEPLPAFSMARFSPAI